MKTTERRPHRPLTALVLEGDNLPLDLLARLAGEPSPNTFTWLTLRRKGHK